MKRTAIVGIHSWVLWSLIVSSAFNLNQHLELNGSRSRRCRQTVKVETDDRHKYVDAYDTTGDGGGMYTHHRTPVGIYKRNLEQANSNHFVLATVFLSFDERMYMGGRRRGGFCTPFAGEMEALRDALAVGKGPGRERERTMTKELSGVRWL